MTKFTDTLRNLADFIETADYDTEGVYNGVTFSVDTGGNINAHMPYGLAAPEHKKAVRKLLRAIGGKWDKDPSDSTMLFRQDAAIGEAKVTVFTQREAVCERKVVGTETVKHAAVKAYTETVELVEWDCGSLLADEKPAESALDTELAEILNSEQVPA